MSAFHGLPVVSGVFDDPNLVSCAGLVPVLGLGRRCGLGQLLGDRLTVSGPGAADPAGKVTAVLAGMIAGADSIEDLGLLRHGGLPRLLGRVWARRRWARSCGSSASVMSASSTRSPPGSCRG